MYNTEKGVGCRRCILADTTPVLFALRRVILLRSYIRLLPSVIAFGSFGANKIPLKPQGFNKTIAKK